MLFRDPDVDESFAEPFAERQQTSRVGHCGGDGDELAPGLALDQHRLAERRGVRPRLELGHVVHGLDRVVLGRRVSVALVRDAMDHDRAVEATGQVSA